MGMQPCIYQDLLELLCVCLRNIQTIMIQLIPLHYQQAFKEMISELSDCNVVGFRVSDP